MIIHHIVKVAIRGKNGVNGCGTDKRMDKQDFRRVVEMRMTRVAVQMGEAMIMARWWLLRLDCGHEVIRQRKSKAGCPRRCHCDHCRNRDGN